jgi:glycosyltransferase involved in cell wall biosynthesis
MLRDLVVCSLEAWDDIWRRNQFLVAALLRRNSALRVLFVEPPADALFDLTRRRRPALPRFRHLSDDHRLSAFRPLKALPRRLGSMVDAVLFRQVRLVAHGLGLKRPLLWINDVTYAPLIEQTGWPSLYDITDDWLLAPAPPRELERLRQLDAMALARADEVVVCSPALASIRGRTRSVSLVPNAVDVEHFRKRRRRPADLPSSPSAVYVGSLHEARLDVDLVTKLADTNRELEIVLVGPDSLDSQSRLLLASRPNIHLLGARAYQDVPAYLQHADVVIVPHRVTSFTDSLDPIKVYECLAVETPTVATPVAGFREQSHRLNIAAREDFPKRVDEILASPRDATKIRFEDPPDWTARAIDFEAALRRARMRH